MSIGENSFPILKYIQTYVYGFRAFYLQNKHTHTEHRREREWDSNKKRHITDSSQKP